MNHHSRILISGAGVAGLTAAIWLGEAGYRPLIVEKAPEIRADGYILSLSHHCYRLLAEMGVLEKLQILNNQVRESSYYDRRGRAILSLDYARLFEAGNIVQIMRDDLETVLYERAKDCADFIYANSVSAFAERPDSVAVTFEDGRQQEFDLVIGADGLHSRVRDCAFSEREVIKHFLGLHAVAFRSSNLLGLSHQYEAYLEPHRHTIVYTTRNDELACIFIWADAAPTVPNSPRRRLDCLREAYRGADPRARRLIDSRAPDDALYMDTLMQIEMPRWHTMGRVVLVGDAAHALTQLSGQGASLSIAGASTLARALSQMPRADAFQHYQNSIQPIIRRLQPATRKKAWWYVPGGLMSHYLRDWAMRFIPNEVWVRYFKAKYSNA